VPAPDVLDPVRVAVVAAVRVAAAVSRLVSFLQQYWFFLDDNSDFDFDSDSDLVFLLSKIQSVKIELQRKQSYFGQLMLACYID